jgi:hypothetical protein
MIHASLPHNHFSLLFQIALDLFCRPSPSEREGLVRSYTVEHLEHSGFTVSIDEVGNVLAVRGTPAPGDGYPLLSFHMDCVSLDYTYDIASLPASTTTAAFIPELFSDAPRSRSRAKRRQGKQLALRSPQALEITGEWLHSRGTFVLGGDDKCGGAIALCLAAMTTMPLKIVASVQEEIGCVGIEQVDPGFFEDTAYALVLDRRGANHLVVSIAGQRLCQTAFAAAMLRAAATTGLLAYPVEGMLSDARTLASYIPNVVNLSVGYYRPHTAQERVSLADLWRSYQWVHEALGSLPRNSADLDRLAAPQEELVCPHCQKLTIQPAAVSAYLWRFVCQCASSSLR